MSVTIFDYIKLHAKPLMMNAVGYMNAKRGSTGVESFSKKDAGWLPDEDALNFYRPYFRTIEGHDHTMFVMDIDAKVSQATEDLYTDDEVRELKIRAVMEEFDDPKWKDHLTYISGQGMYLVQRFDEVVNKMVFEKVAWGNENSLFQPCKRGDSHSAGLKCDGYHEMPQDLVKFRMVKGELVQINIDKRMFNHEGGRLFRGVYSPYFKIVGSTYFCVPIIWDGDSMDIDATLHSSRRENLEKPTEIYVPPFSYENLIVNEIQESILAPIKKKSGTYVASTASSSWRMNVPLPTDTLTKGQEFTNDEIESLLIGDEVDTPPCVKNNFEQKYNRFWSRMLVVRYLAQKGYTPDEIGTFIRFRVNDEEDNQPQNLNGLMAGMNKSLGRDPYNPPPYSSCETLQDEGHAHYSCTIEDRNKCKRSYALHDYPIKLNMVDSSVSFSNGIDQFVSEEKYIEVSEKTKEQQKKEFERINTLINQAISMKDNLEISKTTRAGVTTSLIYNMSLTGKKMLVVSPTNKIGEETFPQAMRIAHQFYDVDITGAILSANTKSCLKLRFQILDLEHRKSVEKDWGDYGVKYNDLAFHFKPSCIHLDQKKGEYIECEYYMNRFPNPYISDDGVPLPVIKSEETDYDYNDGVQEGICAYTSVVNELKEFDILFITYDKLNSILMNNKSDDAELIRNALLSDFDVVFMDEISQLAQHSPLQFTVYREDREGVVNNSFFDNLHDEFDKLITKYSNETAQLLAEYVDLFYDTYFPIVNNLFVTTDNRDIAFSIRHDNPIEDKEEFDEMFTAFYTMIENYAKSENVHLAYLEKMIILFKSEFWWIQNVPTNEYSLNGSFISSPKLINIRNFIQDFDSLDGKQVLITDATMPLIKMTDLFGIDVKKFIVGDPRNTCDHQLVISDTKNINSKRLMNDKSPEYRSLRKFINQVISVHGVDNIMLVLPNKGGVHKNIREDKASKRLPRGLDVTYYRSDKTVGVSSDKRIMIAVCPPHPPSGSYQWLAQYYHTFGLFTEDKVEDLSKKLEDMNAFQTFYQTIGRVKSPSNSERSVVYAWGMNKAKVLELLSMDKDVPLPHIATYTQSSSFDKFITNVGSFWRNEGVIANANIIKVAKYLEDRLDTKYTIPSVISRCFRGANKALKASITEEIMNMDSIIQNVYGIYTEEGSDDKLYIYSK